MRDLEQAQMLLTTARKDFQALTFMSDADKFPVEIFGFHVQQAVEKGLKAWLCCLGLDFPKMHDLDELGARLKDAGQRFPQKLNALLEYTDFAVAFRYDAYPELAVKIDRRRTTDLVGNLLRHVEAILHRPPATDQNVKRRLPEDT